MQQRGQPCKFLQTLLWQQHPEPYRDVAGLGHCPQFLGWPAVLQARQDPVLGPELAPCYLSLGLSRRCTYAVCIYRVGMAQGKHQHFIAGNIPCNSISLATHCSPSLHAQRPSSTLVLLPAAGSSMLTDDIPTAPAPSRDAVVNAIQQLNAAPQLELFGADIDVMADTDEEDDDKEEKKDKKNHGEVDATALATVTHCRCWLVSLLACQPPISLRGNKNAARLAWGA